MSPRLTVPLIDLEEQHERLGRELMQTIERVVRGGSFILGSEVEGFEIALGHVLGTRYVLGLSSGTDALLMALLATGIGPGDQVITTAFTFFATVEVILRVGATPILVDIDPHTGCIDPTQVAAAITKRTRAVIPVHLFGCPASPASLAKLCKDAGLWLIEDAAQALGGQSQGQPLGTFGDFGCFSFFPSKPIGALGDAGALFVASADHYDRCRALRVHGALSKNRHSYLGGNFRLDELQAAVLRVKLHYLAEWREARQRRAETYDRAFAPLGGLTPLGRGPRADSALAHYVVRVHSNQRNNLQRWLTERGIGNAVYYPLPIHQQPLFRELQLGPTSLPETERSAEELLALPLYPELSEERQGLVVEAVKTFFSSEACAG